MQYSRSPMCSVFRAAGDASMAALDHLFCHNCMRFCGFWEDFEKIFIYIYYMYHIYLL